MTTQLPQPLTEGRAANEQPAKMAAGTARLTLGGQAYPLRWDFGAIYLLQESGRASAFDELGGPKGLKASIDLLWAMLPDEARVALASDTPKSLARALSAEKLDGEAIIDLLHAALSEGTGSTAEAKKNATSTSPSPALS